MSAVKTQVSTDVSELSPEEPDPDQSPSLSEDPPVSDLPEEREPNFEVMLPDGTKLRAVGFEEDEYPGICIYARSPGKPPAIICLTEYNPEKTEGHRLYIGAYQSHLDDPKYYEPYVAERN